MTRLIPLTLREGTRIALDAHRVTSVVELPDGLVRIFVDNRGEYFDVPGTLEQLSTLLSDPPVRLVQFGAKYVNPARVAWVCADPDETEGSQVWFSAKSDDKVSLRGSDFISVDCPLAEVVAKLEGRAP